MEPMIYKKEEIAAIKIVLGSLEYQSISISVTMDYATDLFCQLFQNSKDKKFLNLAVMHIIAYLEMGFVYDEHKEYFDKVFNLLQIDRESVLPQTLYAGNRSRKTSRNEIRNMIHRWSSSKYHTKTKEEVIEDIMEKVKNRKIGIYCYHSNQNPNSAGMDDIYELVINEVEIYLRDVRKNKFHKIY